MSPLPMLPRAVIAAAVVFGLALSSAAVAARTAPGPAARAWLSDLVTRIDAADRAGTRPGPGRGRGTVVVHVQIAADGVVQGAEIEESSGSAKLDQRALRAVQGISPAPAPPAALLGVDGIVDLSIPVALGH
ncbi:protein TonB [Methylobacterium sp. UNC300MFChir4.1]|uniref:energy transducer TonB n=1 Tax=Methylobacterium sp. UNC300MFChir4.1 TaxID=1502747 RepID=UPI0008D2D7D8|nr:TonB family protein [Methylobacterium sp. UNC300MFChir4.1]SEO49639.1 protein TonB [Methylobacterium sp. UNC300MFChir4.1]